MDAELNKRLREIEDLAGTAAMEASDGLDVLDVRREIEEAEGRLADFIRENTDYLAGKIEANAEAIERLNRRLDEVAGMVEVVQAELPAE